MTERMRAHARSLGAQRDIPADEAIDAAARQARATIVHKQRVDVRVTGSRPRSRRGSGPATRCWRPPGDEDPPVGQVGTYGGGGALVERYYTLPSALPEHADHPSAQIDVSDIQAGQLAQAKA